MPVSKRLLCLVACLMVVLVGCNDENGTTVVDATDCGLAGDELISSWTVDYTGSVSTLTAGCDVPAHDNSALSVNTAAIVFASVNVTAAGDSPSYLVEGDLGSLAPGGPELKAAVSVDTCIALVQVWEEDDKAFVQCIGEFDRNSRMIQAFCDAAEVDSNEDGVPDATCGIVADIQANIFLGP